MEEFGDGDALAADEELAGGVVGFVEGGDTGEGLLATTAFDLYGAQGISALGQSWENPDEHLAP